jgi:hypothetical protein
VKDRLPRFGQLNTSTAAFEQPHPEIVLEAPDRNRQRGLRHIEALRGASEAQDLGEDSKLLQLTKVHDDDTLVITYQQYDIGLVANQILLLGIETPLGEKVLQLRCFWKSCLFHIIAPKPRPWRPLDVGDSMFCLRVSL